MANMVTNCRIVGSIVLLFFPAFSLPFYLLQLLCGLTDMIDGAIARKTNTVSTFGARLDTIADFILVAICLVKLLPEMRIPNWLWGWMVGIAILKIANVVLGFVYQKTLVVEHTIMNKITGLLLFLLPFTVSWVALNYTAIVVCCIATLAAIQEGYDINIKRTIE